MTPTRYSPTEHQDQSGGLDPHEPSTQSTVPPQSSPDYGEDSYRGHGRLAGQRALITGGASGIGKAVAIAFLREGSDVALCYHNRHEHAAQEIKQIGREAWKRCLLLPGDTCHEDFYREVVHQTVTNLGALDTLVINVDAAGDCESLAELSQEAILDIFSTTMVAPLLITREASTFFEPGSSIIITASLHQPNVNPDRFDHELAKSAIAGFTRGLASELSEIKVRVNAVIPASTPLPSPTSEQVVVETGTDDLAPQNVTQPVDLAGAYVYLASREAENVTGATITVPTGERLIFH